MTKGKAWLTRSATLAARTVVLSLVSVVWLSCTDHGGDTRTGQRGEPARTRQFAPQVANIQWMFKPTAAERAGLDSLLVRAAAEFRVQPNLVVGELYQLPPSRYVLATSVADSSGIVLRFLALVPGPNQGSWVLSPALARDRPGNFAVTHIADFDGDGVADVAYCVWPDTPGSPGVARVLGLRDDRWYYVGDPDAAPPPCGPTSEP